MADSIALYHNPRCSKSRQALALLQDAGVEPDIVRYLDTPADEAALRNLLVKLGIEARELLRRGEPEFRELQLGDASKTEADIIAAMAKHPRLIERPIAIRGERAVVGRPAERVLELL